jgi:hypothetical protein
LEDDMEANLIIYRVLLMLVLKPFAGMTVDFHISVHILARDAEVCPKEIGARFSIPDAGGEHLYHLAFVAK